MRAAFASALLATAASAYQLTVWSESSTTSLASNRLTVSAYVDTEWYWGLRSKFRWGLFEDWHEAWAWGEEVYTSWNLRSSLSVDLKKSNGVLLYGITLKPWIRFWDIVFFENLLTVWPHEFGEAEAWDHCNYMGWWYKMGQWFVDVDVRMYECKLGVHGQLANSVGY